MKGGATRLAVVTGGARGIGLAIARRLVAEGFAVVAASRTPVSDLPAGMTHARLDVTDRAAVAALFAGLGKLDLLVNNAGLAGGQGSDAGDDADDALWHAILATNLTGAWYCSRAALARLPARTGRIVNIASVLGLRGVADQPAYVAAKHGLVGLTRAMAMQAAPRGITVNAICPGWVDTAMAARRYAEIGITAAQAAAGIPTGRVASPAEVADIVAFLAGPGAGSITGQAIAVDGGSSAHA
ncbi:MAG: SDR family oxidoreductase [Acetobacteraceae bacterium]|nr:SDR family oxidoreductase [Acetobacteraceae bacterium]